MSEDFVIDPNDPVLETDFIKEITRQIRATDSYGVYDTAADIEVFRVSHQNAFTGFT